MWQGPRLIIALEHLDRQQALALLKNISPQDARVKIGFEHFIRYGHAFVAEVRDLGFDVFLDLKLHDIPNTVLGACRALQSLSIWMCTVHIQGGQAMLEAAREGLEASQAGPCPLLMGVTVLTSLDSEDLCPLGLSLPVEKYVANWAQIAAEAALDGVICSPMELSVLQPLKRQGLFLVTPGVRYGEVGHQDQKRVATPAEAFARGADALVVGRSITENAYPCSVINQIKLDIPHQGVR